MSVYVGAFSHTTGNGTGNRTISSLPFQPTEIEFMTGGRSGVTENSAARYGFGFTDGTTQRSTAHLYNSDGKWTRNYSDRCLIALDTSGGAVIKGISAEFVSFNSDGFTLNFLDANTDYNIYFRMRN